MILDLCSTGNSYVSSGDHYSHRFAPRWSAVPFAAAVAEVVAASSPDSASASASAFAAAEFAAAASSASFARLTSLDSCYSAVGQPGDQVMAPNRLARCLPRRPARCSLGATFLFEL